MMSAGYSFTVSVNYQNAVGQGITLVNCGDLLGAELSHKVRSQMQMGIKAQ